VGGRGSIHFHARHASFCGFPRPCSEEQQRGRGRGRTCCRWKRRSCAGSHTFRTCRTRPSRPRCVARPEAAPGRPQYDQQRLDPRPVLPEEQALQAPVRPWPCSGGSCVLCSFGGSGRTALRASPARCLHVCKRQRDTVAQHLHARVQHCPPQPLLFSCKERSLGGSSCQALTRTCARVGWLEHTSEDWRRDAGKTKRFLRQILGLSTSTLCKRCTCTREGQRWSTNKHGRLAVRAHPSQTITCLYSIVDAGGLR
jgi:hypothetical protein